MPASGDQYLFWPKPPSGTVVSTTAANPTVLTTATNHGLVVGDLVFVTATSEGGLNNKVYSIDQVPTITSVRLAGTNSAGSVGGTWRKVTWGTGSRNFGTTPEQLPAHPCQMARVVAGVSNTGQVYVGNSSALTNTVSADNETSGLQLGAGGDTGWLPVSNTDQLWVAGSAASQAVTFMWVA